MNFLGDVFARALGDGDPRAGIEGHSALIKVMNLMRLSKSDASRLCHIFESVDADSSGTVEVAEFLAHFDLRKAGAYATRAFSTMDFEEAKASEGGLDYGEFLLGLYNFCTMTREALTQFTFAMIDADASGSIEPEEILDLLKTMHDEDKVGKVFDLVVAALDNHAQGQISYESFRDASQRVGHLMRPALALQKRLQARCMGEEFWATALKDRQEVFGESHTAVVSKYLELQSAGSTATGSGATGSATKSGNGEDEGNGDGARGGAFDFGLEGDSEDQEDGVFQDVDAALQKARGNQAALKKARRGARITLMKMRFRRHTGLTASANATAFAAFRTRQEDDAVGPATTEVTQTAPAQVQQECREGTWWREVDAERVKGSQGSDDRVAVSLPNAVLLERLSRAEEAAAATEGDLDGLLEASERDLTEFQPGWRVRCKVQAKRCLDRDRGPPKAEDDDSQTQATASSNPSDSLAGDSSTALETRR